MFCEFCPKNGGYCCVCVDHNDGKPNGGCDAEEAYERDVTGIVPIHVPIQKIRKYLIGIVGETSRDQS